MNIDKKELWNTLRVFHRLLHIYDNIGFEEITKSNDNFNEKFGIEDSVSLVLIRNK